MGDSHRRTQEQSMIRLRHRMGVYQWSERECIVDAGVGKGERGTRVNDVRVWERELVGELWAGEAVMLLDVLLLV